MEAYQSCGVSLHSTVELGVFSLYKYYTYNNPLQRLLYSGHAGSSFGFDRKTMGEVP